jgi:hypothetical protein
LFFIVKEGVLILFDNDYGHRLLLFWTAGLFSFWENGSRIGVTKIHDYTVIILLFLFLLFQFRYSLVGRRLVEVFGCVRSGTCRFVFISG